MSVALAQPPEPNWRRVLRHAETVAMIAATLWVITLFLLR